jgi:thioredoxin-related protein
MRFIFCLLLIATLKAHAGDSTKLYDPTANAAKDVAHFVEKAKQENKHVLLQIGGNWCVWCYKFNAFVQTDSVLKKLLDDDYVTYHLNYSPENKNEAYLKTLGDPQRYGFPVLVVLDENGKQLYTQDTSLLEKGNGYNFEKVKNFFLKWAPEKSM